MTQRLPDLHKIVIATALSMTLMLGGVALMFGGVAARTYTIEFTDALGNGTWFRLTNIIARATNHTEQILDPNYTTNRFYRIVTPWRP